MPPIVVILLTYARTAYALRTIQAAIAYLRYTGPLLWYVADDGSAPEHYQVVISALAEHLVGAHSEKLGYGGNANKAWETAQAHSPLTFWLEDDWELTREFSLDGYAQLLQERSDIGMVRAGYLNLNMAGRVFGHGGQLYWKLERDCDSYVFTGHPALRHWRYREAYGLYPTGLNPGETELAYALQYRQGAGPDIVWPAGLGEWGAFGHIGAEKSY